jgi:hypothetical protein
MESEKLAQMLILKLWHPLGTYNTNINYSSLNTTKYNCLSLKNKVLK